MIDVTNISSVPIIGSSIPVYTVDGVYVTSPDHEPSIMEVRVAKIIDHVATLDGIVSNLINTLKAKGVLP